jgi:transposase InsO family protein
MPFFDNSRYLDALLPSISYFRCFPPVYTGAGLSRRSSIKARIFWNKIFDTATSANWNVTYQKDVTLDFSRPGKPTDNAFIESFNGKFRAECLNTHWFMTLDDARTKMEDWRKDYNEVRPHSAIGYNVPISLHKDPAAERPP